MSPGVVVRPERALVVTDHDREWFDQRIPRRIDGGDRREAPIARRGWRPLARGGFRASYRGPVMNEP